MKVMLVGRMQGVARKVTTKLTETGKLKGELRKNPVLAKSIVDKVASDKRIRDKLIAKGVFTKIKSGNKIVLKLDYDKLESTLSKDSKLRKEFFSIAGEKAQALGLGTKLGKETAGRIVTKTGIRVGKIEEELAGSSFSLSSATEFNKLVNLGNDLANKFTKGNFSVFMKKYSEDRAFREKVNHYIENKIANDPEFSALKGVNPSHIVSAVASAKGAVYTRGQYFREALVPSLKGAGKAMGMTAAQMGVMLGSYVVTSINLNVMGTVMPQSTGAYWASLESLALMRQMNAFSSPRNLVGMESQRELMERQGVMAG
jgi:hypothetical protein